MSPVDSASRGNRLKIAALVTGVAICVGIVVLTSYPYSTFERSVRNAAGGHLDDLSVIVDYLSPPLAKGDYRKFWERSEAVMRTLERHDVSNRPDEYVSLLDEAGLNAACRSPQAVGSVWLTAMCEWKALADSGEEPLDCGKFENSETRAECRRTNDSKFSAESDAHCSKADCLIDNAVFKTAALGTPACSELPAPLVGNCQTVLASYREFARDPASFEKPELENALLGKTDDAAWLSARKAVLENPDSPSDECRDFEGAKSEECEKKTKALFSYVQLRGLKNRLSAIHEAVKDFEKNHANP